MKKAKKNIITQVTVTCYQPVESQCDSDPLITADGAKNAKQNSMIGVPEDALEYINH